MEDIRSREYRVVSYRPMLETSIARFGIWLRDMNWREIYESEDVNFKAEFLQKTLLAKYEDFFQ